MAGSLPCKAIPSEHGASAEAAFPRVLEIWRVIACLPRQSVVIGDSFPGNAQILNHRLASATLSFLGARATATSRGA